ncbi:MAG: Maf family nucleotide pyrophosphatase [Bacteroidales bacterium]|nr:Maf family nucleotide pyrophosphatase [Bacteroidales bacterium]MCF8388878.1 Maf family nucleotide pyrophosphatase [Bacteroidales bacterium]MCF8399205.1 Maf family nucleotide pyrophosphatase [Bacteroidales bacterium]
MLDNLKKYRIILASQSPRRRNLLKMLDVDFETASVDVDESMDINMNPKDASIFLAEKKANAFSMISQLDNELIITADTMVYLRNRILGKPENFVDAFKTISSLSGHWHTVVSGVCIMTKDLNTSFSVETEVHFKKLSEQEIRYYIENYQPYDKAGAYGIQEWIGYIGIDCIRGSFYNVMGLPVQRLYEELKKL